MKPVGLQVCRQPGFSLGVCGHHGQRGGATETGQSAMPVILVPISKGVEVKHRGYGECGSLLADAFSGLKLAGLL